MNITNERNPNKKTLETCKEDREKNIRYYINLKKKNVFEW